MKRELITMDFTYIIDSSMAILTPETDAAWEWLNENVQSESWQWLGRSLAIDRRYLADILDGIIEAGLRC